MEQDIIILEPLWSLLRCCEVNCVAACCGLDAFDFNHIYVKDWLNTVDLQTLKQVRQQLQEIARVINNGDAVSSSQLNFWGDRQQWRELIHQWRKMLMLQNCAIPILPSRNLTETTEFYQKLGFETVADYEAYVILCRDSIEIHFSLLPEIISSESYAECYLRITNVDDLFQEFSRLALPTEGIPRLGALEDKPWGMREFYVVDPSGNLLKIGQVIGED